MNHQKFAILFREEPKWGINTEIAHIWKAYLTHEIVRKNKGPKYNESSKLLCTTHHSVQQFTMSGKIKCSHWL